MLHLKSEVRIILNYRVSICEQELPKPVLKSDTIKISYYIQITPKQDTKYRMVIRIIMKQ